MELIFPALRSNPNRTLPSFDRIGGTTMGLELHLNATHTSW